MSPSLRTVACCGSVAAFSIMLWIGLGTPSATEPARPRIPAEPVANPSPVTADVAAGSPDAARIAAADDSTDDLPAEPYVDPDAPAAWEPTTRPVTVGEYQDPDGPGLAPADGVAHVGEWVEP